MPLIKNEILISLQNAGYEVLGIPLKGNESIKSLETITFLENKLLPFVDRQTTLISIGGGAIGDVVGFAASILLRGLPWIYLPTTLLAQVDSSIGGKTAINSTFGKNLIGSFHFPALVITDTLFLKTLSKKQIASGLVELTKHALIQDCKLFDELEQNHFILLNDINKLTAYILKSIQLKIAIIDNDWFENKQGTRQFLNLGHTFAHAFEAVTKNNLLHGEAVALGLCAAYDFAAKKGVCSENERNRVKDYLDAIGMPVNYQPLFYSDIIFKYFKIDKKKSGENITLVLPNGIGKGCQIFSFPQSNIQLIFRLFSKN